MTSSITRPVRASKRDWSDGTCHRGHDITDPANVRILKSGRLCIPCDVERAAGRSKPVKPWGDSPTCHRGHPVTKRRETLRRRVDGVYTLVCRECLKVEEVEFLQRQLDLAEPVAPVSKGVEPWMARGACIGEDHEGYSNRELADYAAWRGCARCPVLEQCGAYADRHCLEGLWGGEFRTSEGGGKGSYIKEPIKIRSWSNGRVTNPVKRVS